MLYVKILGSKVRVFGDLAALAAPLEVGGGNSTTWDDTISEEDWEKANYIARVVNGKIIYGEPEDIIYERNAEIVRNERYLRLRQCDKMSPMRWNVLTEEQKQAWADYRQALLDIPQQEGFPWGGDINIVPWPVKPE